VSWLLVTKAWPWPVRRGLQARTIEIAALLAERGEATVLCPEPPSDWAVRAMPAELPYKVVTYRVRRAGRPIGLARAAIGGRSLQSGLYAGGELARRFHRLADSVDRVLLQTGRLSALSPLPERDRLVVDLIDSLSLNFERRARFDRALLKPIWLYEAFRLRRDERRLVEASRSSFVVSERDRGHLEEVVGAELAPRLGVVPLAIAKFPEPGPERPGDDRFTLLTTGNLGYFPTRHGLDWFLEEVWPAVRTAVGGARLVVAGSRASSGLERRLRGAGGELVRDPPDLATLHLAADLALAPLFAGSGTPMKLLEAIGAGLPALATPFAAAGLDPAIAAGIEVSGEAAGWIDAVRRAAAERDSWRARAAAARRAALAVHSPGAVSDRFWRTVDR